MYKINYRLNGENLTFICESGSTAYEFLKENSEFATEDIRKVNSDFNDLMLNLVYVWTGRNRSFTFRNFTISYLKEN